MPRIVITMPAFQAEGTLERTIADIPAGTADELILVDDASVDNTVELARGLGITVHVHPENRGYGANQKTCYRTAIQNGADIVVLLHPDYQYDPRAVPLLVAPILGGYADMTFGSRFAGLGDPRAGGMPLYRFVGNRITTILQNILLGSRFSEMHSGLRAYTRECLLSLPFLDYSDDFAFDSQMVVDAVTTGKRVVEVPIPTRYTKESSSISVIRSLKYILLSVLYAGGASLRRGRRGRRWPGRDRSLPKRRGPARRQDPVARAISLAEGFVTTTRTLVVVAASGTRAADWELVHSGPDVPAVLNDKVGLVLVDLDGVSDPAGTLRAIRSRVDDEALLAVTATGDLEVARTLTSTGFRIIHWDKDGDASIVMARPGR